MSDTATAPAAPTESERKHIAQINALRAARYDRKAWLFCFTANGQLVATDHARDNAAIGRLLEAFDRNEHFGSPRIVDAAL